MHYLCTVIKTNRNMTEILIETKEVSGIMTKSNLPCWWLFGESIRGLHTCLQVLLRLIHEAFHRT